jgi:hypothetical protein
MSEAEKDAAMAQITEDMALTYAQVHDIIMESDTAWKNRTKLFWLLNVSVDTIQSKMESGDGNQKIGT